MTYVLSVTSYWLHTLATIILIGHYLLLALVFLPAIKNHLKGVELAGVLKEISTRSRSWINIALLVFLLSGVYLMIADANYPGFGRIFANGWTIFMVIKHILVVAMIFLAFRFNAKSVRLEANPALPASLSTLLRWTNLCGLAVLLLTAVAQGL